MMVSQGTALKESGRSWDLKDRKLWTESQISVSHKDNSASSRTGLGIFMKLVKEERVGVDDITQNNFIQMQWEYTSNTESQIKLDGIVVQLVIHCMELGECNVSGKRNVCWGQILWRQLTHNKFFKCCLILLFINIKFT